MANRGKTVRFKRTDDKIVDDNFESVKAAFYELGPAALGYLTDEISLVAGDNRITPTIPGPRGRFTVFQSAAADLTDQGLNSEGQWVVTASAPCRARFIFI